MKCHIRPMMKPATIVAVGVAILSSAVGFAQQNYNPAKVLEQTRTAYSHTNANASILVIGAHRGIFHGIKGCPENSPCAIEQTYRNSIEAIEIDVRTSTDGTPWCFHDVNVGRMTNYPVNGQQYDPFNNSGPNPTVSSMSDRTLSTLHLKDSIYTGNAGGTVTGYYAMTLARALQIVKSQYPHMAVFVDVKNGSDAHAADAVVRSAGMTSSVVLKSNWRTFDGYSPSSKNVPVVGAGDLDAIAAINSNESPQAGVNSYVAGYKYNALYMELRMRTYDTGPVAGTYDYAHNIYGLGSYNPSPDVNGKYYNANGSCAPCQNLIDGLARTNHFGNETVDDREQQGLHLNYFRTTLSDEPTSLAESARNAGRRNTGVYF